jgi:hypothetical protein
MAKILSYKNKRNNITIIILLIVSIVITNSFIVFSPDENSRSYFSNLTSTVYSWHSYGNSFCHGI